MRNRLHGQDAIRHAEQHGGQLFVYGWHQPGKPAGLEEVEIDIEGAKLIAVERPFVVYIDVEEGEAK